ncbi:transposable element tc3 transposase [Plakobranchus ocellatus]|uniref:Transposable element tc3 transposase n=1 Tax=Plakobranchus ocellatus TaxID=259542 RepID=A0AAV4E0Z2_9GAST|nr:transposable element tc3 transposase [Plakobranchus ocellatus]
MAVLNKYWVSLGRRRGVVRASQWFQQDGATSNTANETIAWLRQRFEERLISRRCDVEWARTHQILTPPDFYLWGFLKDNVYQGNPQTIEELNMPSQQK